LASESVVVSDGELNFKCERIIALFTVECDKPLKQYVLILPKRYVLIPLKRYALIPLKQYGLIPLKRYVLIPLKQYALILLLLLKADANVNVSFKNNHDETALT
jgi:hypothetical protein